MVDSYKSELYHFGIKGMKWGVRRYQNKDGSLTPAGKKRKEQQENARSHVLASRTVGSAKMAVAAGTMALGSALVGSAVTAALAKHGRTQAAATVLNMSKRVFSEAAFATQIGIGSTIVSGMMTRPESMRDYLNEERRIREKYK